MVVAPDRHYWLRPVAVLSPVSNRTGTSIEFAVRTALTGAERVQTVIVSSIQLLHSGYRSMNTKLALSAVVAALMLTACAKQESAGTAAPPPPAPAADQSGAAAADAKAAADSASQAAQQAGQAASEAGKAAESAAAPATPPPADQPK